MERKLVLLILVAVFGKFLAEKACPMLSDQKPAMRDKAANQLYEFMKNKEQINTLTSDYGAPIGNNEIALTVGPKGPILLQDYVLIEQQAHFNRERIPERVAHAKGAGAFGHFKVTKDITQYTMAKLFSEVGKVTPVAVRLSSVLGERGSPDNVREPRGFAVKFYTEDGNWDLPGINFPVFFIRHPLLFPGVVHGLKKNPVTNLQDVDMFWDVLSLKPETVFVTMMLFSDSGTIYNYRYMNGHGVNTFKLVNENNEAVYCKFHWKSNQGVKSLSDEQSKKLGGSDPDFCTRDLYNSIANGEFPSWTMNIQVMTFDQANNSKFNPFDATKIWPADEFPWMEVGVLTLDKNPTNYFAQVEQLAFAPSSLVKGIEPSPDKLLQARLFAYRDTQRYRLGANYHQIPVNNALNATVRNYNKDGFQTVTDNQDGAPNYYPNSFCGPKTDPSYKEHAFSISGDVVDRWEDQDEDNFSQPGVYYNEMSASEKTNLIENMANHLMHAQLFIQQRAVKNFEQVDNDFAARLKQELQNRQQTGK